MLQMIAFTECRMESRCNLNVMQVISAMPDMFANTCFSFPA